MGTDLQFASEELTGEHRLQNCFQGNMYIGPYSLHRVWESLYLVVFSCPVS